MIHNLEYYKVFYYVASCGGLTPAAERLAISQPAVSQSMKQLEASLGVKLFLRAARGIRLTQEGELLYSYVAKGYEQIEAGEKKLRQMLNLELGEIRIGASDMTLRFYLLPFLEKFHEKYPRIKVTVTNAPTPETLPLICLEKNTSTRSYMDGYLRENGVEIQPEFELATSDMIVQFALRNLGSGKRDERVCQRTDRIRHAV